MPADSGKPYQVFVNDNGRYMDESARYLAGAFDTCEQATERCREIVDRCLADHHAPAMSASQLLEWYKAFGEDPWILAADAHCTFSAWTYAEERCRTICARDTRTP
jgi:hypothetical protein